MKAIAFDKFKIPARRKMKIKYFFPDSDGDADDTQEVDMDNNYDFSQAYQQQHCFEELAKYICRCDWPHLYWWREDGDVVPIAIITPDGKRFDCNVSVSCFRQFKAALVIAKQGDEQ